ncbi:MAG: glycoside hydrolase family 99-like domain-containing protein [Chloroflexi bacterium]|nr:glycoside hydrolase family 99-like domain-containing protein [Chloroflexota bacterium]
MPARSGPLLVAYYYPWYDMSTWTTGITPDQPIQPYLSADPIIMEQHIVQAQEAGIDVFNVAWLGPDNPTDWNLARMLPIAASHNFALTASFEADSPFFSSRQDFVRALRYALGSYAAQPGYLRYEGKPVLFFWRLGAIPRGVAESPVEAWKAVRAAVDPDGLAIWIGEGDRFEYLEVFDGIYPYSVAWSSHVAGTTKLYASRTRWQAEHLGARKLWVATVMPGYDDHTTGRPDAFSRDRAEGAFYDETWRAAIATRPDWVMIVSWNEWVEGSQIEPSRSYGDLYLTATQALVAEWKGVQGALLGDHPAMTGATEFDDSAPPLAPHALSEDLFGPWEILAEDQEQEPPEVVAGDPGAEPNTGLA